MALSYFSILVTEFLAPYGLHSRHTDFIFAPPQRVHLIHEGRFVGPFVYPLSYKLDMDTLKREYTPDTSRAAAHPLPLLRRALQVLGSVRRQTSI